MTGETTPKGLLMYQRMHGGDRNSAPSQRERRIKEKSLLWALDQGRGGCGTGRIRITSVSTVYFGDCLKLAGNRAEHSCHGNAIPSQMTTWHKDNVGAKKVQEAKLPVRQTEGGRQSPLTYFPVIKCQMYTMQ